MATAKETGDTVGVHVNPAVGDAGDASSTEVDLRNAPEEEQIAANADLEKQLGTHTADTRSDDNIVFWSEGDPQNPYNWPSWLKVLNCTLVSSLTFLTPLGSSMFAPGVMDIMIEFKATSTTLASFCVSVYVLGFAAGPLIFAPLSEIYGRTIIYHGTNVCFCAFLVACALSPSFNSLIAFRFLSGLFGSVPLTNGGGTIADMIRPDKRAAAMGAFAIGPLLGPIIGPVAGGFVADNLGWRWVFWILAILSGSFTILFFIVARETYAPILLQRKVDQLRKETGNMNLRSKLDEGLQPRDYFKRGIIRPFKLMAFSPICIFAAFYVGVAYGYLYLLFVTLTPLFTSVYGFSSSLAGLCFLGLGVGSMIGVVGFSLMSDRYTKRKQAEDRLAAEAAGREPAGDKPEYRLPALIPGSFALPAGLFIYGWTAKYAVHWIVPILGTAVVGFGNILIFMSLQMYLVDSFEMYSASALASNAVVRSVFGAVLPMAALPMFDTLGLGWGNSLLGFIAMAVIPAAFLFIKYGEYLRTTYTIKNL